MSAETDGNECCDILIAPFTLCDRPTMDDDTMCAEHRVRMLADLVVQMREQRDAALADTKRMRDKLGEVVKYWVDAEHSDPHWEITIWVPEEAGEAFHERLFDGIADLAHDSEEAVSDRTWDVFCVSSKGHPSVPVHEIDRALVAEPAGSSS